MKIEVMAKRNFDKVDFQIIQAGDDFSSFWLPGKEIGKALQLENPKEAIKQIYKRHRDELEEFSILWTMETSDGPKEVRIFAEEAIYMITFFSQSPKAKEFRRWVAGLIKAYRQGKPGSGPAGRNHLAAMREQRLYMKEQRTFQQYAKEEAGRILRKEGTIEELDQVPLIQDAVRMILAKDIGAHQLEMFSKKSDR